MLSAAPDCCCCCGRVWQGLPLHHCLTTALPSPWLLMRLRPRPGYWCERRLQIPSVWSESVEIADRSADHVDQKPATHFQPSKLCQSAIEVLHLLCGHYVEIYLFQAGATS